MIPHKLRLQNFLSYGEDLDPLEFAGMHLVCLTGQNGHGKSALLDAITWALWGRARAASDDDLIHSGRSEMQVEFEFELAGQRYNVIRKRLIAGRSRRSDLEIGVWEEDAGAWRPLTEPSLRATQTRIIDLLRMEYDTFIHSAFLKQGEADAFTSKSPSQRKDILAAILNLAQYDLYAEQAKTLAREAEGRAALIQQRLREIEAELAQRPQFEEDVRRFSLTESAARAQRSQADQAVAEARLAVQDLANKRAALQELQRRLQQAQRAEAETAQQLHAAATRVQSLEALLAQRQAIEDGYAALATARSEEEAWRKRLQALRPLEQEQQRLQRAWLEAKARAEQALTLAQREAQEAETRARSAAGLSEDAARVRQEIEHLHRQQEEALGLRQQLAGLAASRSQQQTEKERVEVEGKRLRERQEMLRSGETATCPVCRRPLDEEGRGHLEREYETQLQGLREQVRAAQEAMKGIAAAETEAQQALAQIERALRSLPSLQRQAAEIETALEQAQRGAAALPALQAQAAALAQQLAAGAFAAETQAQLTEVAAAIAAQAYDEAAHRQAEATISDLSGLERRKLALEDALHQIAGAREQTQRLQERQQREQAQSAADREQVQQMQAAVQAQAAVETTLQQHLHAADQARSAWERAHAQLAAAQQRLAACEALTATRAQLSAEGGAIQARAARLRQLQEAFGPRGVQAMIMEAALPELETEANRLLARLSDGRMSVRLATQRELKTGGLRETLDIILSDELGSRPYELYSGGEAFRADLALRIALSRLLTRRAGAALQALFIDEGFGTQDAHGRENLIEALHMIKDEFALVLIITHIDELKDQFPARIQVVKEEGVGSRYWVA